MTQIQVLNFPSGVRVPGVYVGIDPSNANTGTLNQNTLIIGQVGTGSTVPVNVPFIATSTTVVDAQCGSANCQLARMYAQYRTLDTFGTVWLLPLADNPAGVAGTQTVTITGATTVAGTVNLYIGGQNLQASTQVADTPTIIAGNLVLAAAGMPTLPVTVTNVAGVITLTNVNKGANAIDVRLNYAGASAGQVTPSGLTIVITAGTAGTANPVMTTALANLIDVPYDFIVSPYNDSVSITAIEGLLNDQTGRWSWEYEVFGHAFGAFVGTFAAIDTFGAAQNNQHISFLGMYDTPTPTSELASMFGATCANSLRSDPALPLTQIPLGCLAPPTASRFSISERETLLYDGISTFIVDQSGTVWLERAVTTSQTLPNGAPTNAYLDVETMYTLMGVIRPIRTALQSKFARTKLVIDGTRITAGSNLVTSQTVLGEVIAQYSGLANLGLVQDVAGFAKAAYAQNVGNGTGLVYCPFNLANQLRIIGLSVAFTKS